MSGAGKKEVISLYRELLRHGNRFSNYNFKEYALRRTRDDFRANMSVTDGARVAELLSKGKADLEVVKRQAALSRMFKPDMEYVINVHKNRM
eukprot:CAMPEP_0173436130 /NCGR_PEP_ID=MMETSP1357-20121228/15776_1 /TAXON_ID=77926 /ORGANISM="Hemiselmis rufescens, Strain PCC563" /LENGTH=91 /DNA_ID=CAMNT_0014401185 /DNA_START=106 /DNA_END=381 /DNA_ORIENTATION=-